MKRLIYILAGFGLLLPVLAFADTNQTAFQLFNPAAIQNGTDLSISYLGDIYGVVDGILHGSGSQVMGKMFTVFNAGALILGGLIVIYTSMISLLNTANEGEMLGKKWNSIWIPLRTVMGIALLIPKSTGYCAIQIFMMWVIVQGVGLADNVWNSVLGYLAEGGVLVQNSLETAQSVGAQAENMMRQTTCLAGMQELFNNAYLDASKNGVKNLPAVPSFIGSISQLPTSSSYCSGNKCTVPLPNFDSANTNWAPLNGACGTVSWTQESAVTKSNIENRSAAAKEAGDLGSLIQAYKDAVRVGMQQMLLDVSGPSENIVNQVIYPSTTTSVPEIKDIVPKQALVNAAQDYEGIVYPAQRSMTDPLRDQMMAAWIALATTEGWIEAGSYYQNMASQNSMAGSAIFTPPTTSGSAQDIGNALNKYVTSSNVPNQYWSYVSTNLGPLKDQLTDGSSTLNTFLANLPQGTKSGNASTSGNISSIPINLSGVAAKIADPLLSPLVNLVQSFIALLTSQGTNANPVAQIALMGDGLIGLVVEVWIVGALTLAGATAVLGIIPSVEEATTMTVLVEWIVPFFWGISGVLFIEGAVMAFYVPMIPFILFLFGAIGWLIATIEAMVAAPLVALGITHPEGAEVLGKSDPAVLLLVNVFLRPSMMIIGFIAGIIMSYVSIWMLNIGFLQVVLGGIENTAGTLLELKAQSPVAMLFGIPFMLVLYITLVIGILNYCFSLINVVPDKVMRWLGGQQEGVAGEAGKMVGDAKGATQGAARATGEQLKDMAGKTGQKEDKSQSGSAKGSKDGDGPDSDKSSDAGDAPQSDVEVSESGGDDKGGGSDSGGGDK